MPKRRPRTSQLLPCLVLGLSLLTQGSCSKRDEEAHSPGTVDPPASENAPPRVGDKAPDFSAVAHSGQRVSLSELRGKVVILYFYPKDGTPGCTTEAQGFRDQYQSFDQAGAVILGVSTQDNESHRAFAEKHNLPFLLLPDEDSTIAKAFGVGSILGFSKRVTFVINRAGTIAQVYENVSPPGHAKEILEDVSSLGNDEVPASEAGTY